MLPREPFILPHPAKSTSASEAAPTPGSGGVSVGPARKGGATRGERPPRFLLLWIGILLLFHPMLRAQAPEPGSPAPESIQSASLPKAEPALLSIGANFVTIFRATGFGYTPEMRVELAESRINEALRDPKRADFTTMERHEGTSILYDDHYLFTIMHEDLDQLTGETMDSMVEHALDALRIGFERHQRGRDPRVILWGVLLSLAYTLVYAGLIYVLYSLLTKAESRLHKRFAGKEMVGELLMDGVVNLRRLLFWLLFLGLTLWWLSLVLEAFPQTEETGSNLTAAFTNSLADLFSGTISATPDLLIAAIIFAVVLTLIRSVNTLLKAVLSGKIMLPGIEDDAARPTATVIKILVVLIGLITAYPYLPGTSSGAFQGISLMAGLIVSLGSATLFAQISAGFVLMYSRSFKRGDWLMLADGTEGRLIETGYLTTRLQTYHEQMSIPNLVLLGQPIKNLSRGPIPEVGLLTVRLTIGYNTPWRQVYRLLLASAEIPGILNTPAPKVFQLELGDFYVTYQLTAYISLSTPRIAIKSSLFESIQDSFNREGIQIMSPHYVLDPNEKVWVPKEQWDPKAQTAATKPPPTRA